MSHANIAIFVPHLGCPHQCTFCNQKHITGCVEQPSPQSVYAAVQTALESRQSPESCEIAFFGGSFTAIDREYMLELLSAASDCVERYGFKGIRISTRPDCIDEEVLTLLKEYRVTAIELGAQSMDDEVLAFNERGHTSDDVRNASELIKKFGFKLGLQMMTGLYKSSYNTDRYTAEELIKLAPQTVRIYPTITLKNTALEALYLSGDYVPDDIEISAKLCSELLSAFETSNIKVIRLGLHSIDDSSYVAGPWHPAFRELCDSYRFRSTIERQVRPYNRYCISVNPADLSKVIGQKKSNILYFGDRNVTLNIIQDKAVSKGTVLVEEVK